MTNTFNDWRGTSGQKTPGYRDLDWQTRAACRNAPLNLFFFERETTKEDIQAAKALCATCPVRTECLDYSINFPERYGIWGGLDEDERAEERRKRMRRTPPAPRQKKPVTPRPRQPKVNATGTRRRLQALAAAGHGNPVISQRIDHLVHSSYLSKIRLGGLDAVRADVAAAVAAVFPQMITEPPAKSSYGVAADAAGRGWLPPQAWDGLDIDDPTTRPRQLEGSAA